MTWPPPALLPGADLGRVDRRADAGGHAAADEARLLERRILADFGDGDLGQDREVREGAAAHVVEDRPPHVAEARGPVWHQAGSLRGADRGAQVGFARETALHWRHSDV